MIAPVAICICNAIQEAAEAQEEEEEDGAVDEKDRNSKKTRAHAESPSPVVSSTEKV